LIFIGLDSRLDDGGHFSLLEMLGVGPSNSSPFTAQKLSTTRLRMGITDDFCFVKLTDFVVRSSCGKCQKIKMLKKGWIGMLSLVFLALLIPSVCITAECVECGSVPTLMDLLPCIYQNGMEVSNSRKRDIQPLKMYKS